MTRKLTQLILLGSLIACLVVPASAADWPTYRHDSQRSGISTERIKAPLSAEWVFTATHPPSHAWGDPQAKPVEGVLELPRMRFDDAFQVAAVGDRVYFGSSSDNKVYALDAGSGEVRWEFYTDGPVRLAPTVWRGRVYVGSDDGNVYCLDAGDGRVVWTFAAAPGAEKVLGNGKMISLWPVRTGVLVADGVAYFGAGVFPGEGLYLYAVGAADGKLLWKNDTYGRGGMGTVSPQGYMVASGDKLFVPSSRSMPAAFSRKDGRFLFHRNFSWRRIGLFGGTYALLAGDVLFTAAEQIVGVHENSGQLAFAEGLPAGLPSKGTRQLVVDKNSMYAMTGTEATGIDLKKWIATRKSVRRVNNLRRERSRLARRAVSDKKLLKQLQEIQKRLDRAVAEHDNLLKRTGDPTKWQAPCTGSGSIVLTRDMVFAGGDGVVKGLDPKTGKELWSATVNGKARGLAVANGRLLVSTDKGSIHCFVQGKAGRGRKVTPPVAANPFPKDKLAGFYARTADAIVEGSGVKRGFGLILGGGTGRLALELAKRTDLMIYVVEPDAKKVAAARKALTAAGVYGGKVVVTQGPIGALPYADYFANLIVCEDGFSAGAPRTAAEEVLRMLKPCGGVAYVGRPPGLGAGGAKAAPATLEDWLAKLRKTLADLGEAGTKMTVRGKWAKIARGPLAGAGSWTHQYAEPGNTACSDDRLVRGPIGILWFGQPGPGDVPNRHASAASPLAVGGRMFVQGENVVMAYDAYNGLPLWKRDIPGAVRLGLKMVCSNLAANDDSVFVAVGDRCLRLDAATGKTLRTYQAPATKDGQRHPWGYVACVGDLLYGSAAAGGVFAVDIESGRTRWGREGKSIMLTTICIGGGRVFFVDRTVTEQQRREGLEGVPQKMRLDRRGKPIKPDVRLVVALNSETGRKEWERPQYVSDCVNISRAGGELTAMVAKGVLLLCGQPWNGHFWREFSAGEFSRRSLIALSAYDGRPLWSGRKGYRSRPLIVGDQIIAEPWAHDLKTGAERLRVHPVTGAKAKWQMSRPGHHCGNIAAGPSALFFRSGTTAYYDLIGDYGTAHFGAQRPGCWINCIPANGLVMMPEASSGCVCPFSLMCTVVFKPRESNRMWGMYSAAGPMTPARHLAVNFGAPGDRKGASGVLWLAYPRPRSHPDPAGQRLVLDFKLGVQMHQGGGYFGGNADFLKIAGTDDAWIYASGCSGLARCTIPLIGKDGAPGKYTVRLHFAKTEKAQPGERVFDVALQGQTVLKAFDIVKEAGGPNKAVVKEFKGVGVKDNLEITLKPVKGTTLLCGVEAVREDPSRPDGAYTVYVIDPHDWTIDSLKRVRDETLKSIGYLRDHQEFHVIFSGAPGAQPRENAPKRLVPPTKGNKAAVAEFLKSIRAEGPTDPIPALKRALDVLDDPGARGRMKLIYLLAGGAFPDSEKVLELIRKRNRNKEVHISTYLYGRRPPEAVELMKTIAAENGGFYKYVSADE